MIYNTSFISGGLDNNTLQKWNCILQPTFDGQKYHGGLYLGDIDSAHDTQLLLHLNIGALLSVIVEPVVILPDHLSYIVRDTISITDSEQEPLINYFPRCSGFIDQHRSHTNVMVHCFAGISRSATVVIAYLMYKFGQGYEKTSSHVRAIRKQINPNLGFVQQLQRLEGYLLQNKKFENGNIQPVLQTQQQDSPRAQLNISFISIQEDRIITQEDQVIIPSPKYMLRPDDLSDLQRDITKRQQALQKRCLRSKIPNTKESSQLNLTTNITRKQAQIYHFPIYKIKQQ